VVPRPLKWSPAHSNILRQSLTTQKHLVDFFSRLAVSRDAHKATACTPGLLRVTRINGAGMAGYASAGMHGEKRILVKKSLARARTLRQSLTTQER